MALAISDGAQVELTLNILLFLAQCIAVFVIASTVFDFVHFLLHRWQRSRIPLLKMFSAWHQVHHDFLDRDMQVHPELSSRNLWAHLVPEFITTLIVTAALALVFPLWPVVANLVLHVLLFAIRVKEEGIDINHMSMDRLDGRRHPFWVSPSYHAMHHVNPLGFYSSMFNIFDLLVGTSVAIRGKRIAVTGSTGAFGGVMVAELERRGAKVIRVGRDLTLDPSEIDILVLAHGARGDRDVTWAANYDTFITLGTAFIAACRERLVPAEIWAVGSEAEIFGNDDYAISKRHFARYASQNWRNSADVTYRHIVPSAFRSRMNWSPFGPKWAVRGALFWISRGFAYAPVTYTSLAFWNWFKYRAAADGEPALARESR